MTARRHRTAHVQLLAVSWNFGWPIAAGVGIGYWIDGRLGTSPLASLGLGLGALAVSISRMIQLTRQEASERREDEVERRALDRQRPRERKTGTEDRERWTKRQP